MSIRGQEKDLGRAVGLVTDSVPAVSFEGERAGRLFEDEEAIVEEVALERTRGDELRGKVEVVRTFRIGWVSEDKIKRLIRSFQETKYV